MWSFNPVGRAGAVVLCNQSSPPPSINSRDDGEHKQGQLLAVVLCGLSGGSGARQHICGQCFHKQTHYTAIPASWLHPFVGTLNQLASTILAHKHTPPASGSNSSASSGCFGAVMTVIKGMSLLLLRPPFF
jgi:hypothetical protein